MTANDAIDGVRDALLALGRPIFAIGIFCFGIEYFRYGHYAGGLPPVPPEAPGGATGAYLVGIFLIASGLAIGFGVRRRTPSLLLGGFTLACVLVLHTPKIIDILTQGTIRTRALEPLALSAAALVLFGDGPASENRAIEQIARFGRLLFAFCMVIFGVQHFLYLQFIASLITAWIPGHVFWVVFTGIGFIAAGLAIASRLHGRAGATWLGIMFLLWFLLEHAPRVAASPQKANEWDSMLVALTLSGASFIVARAMPDRSPR